LVLDKQFKQFPTAPIQIPSPRNGPQLGIIHRLASFDATVRSGSIFAFELAGTLSATARDQKKIVRSGTRNSRSIHDPLADGH